MSGWSQALPACTNGPSQCILSPRAHRFHLTKEGRAGYGGPAAARLSATLHTPDASNPPSGLQATRRTSEVCPRQQLVWQDTPQHSLQAMSVGGPVSRLDHCWCPATVPAAKRQSSRLGSRPSLSRLLMLRRSHQGCVGGRRGRRLGHRGRMLAAKPSTATRIDLHTLSAF